MRRISVVLLLAGYLASEPVLANDLPVTGNRVAEETLIIERGARTRDRTHKAAPRLFSMIATSLRWDDGPLKVCFWNGDQALRGQVAAIADELIAGLPVSFDWQLTGQCPSRAAPEALWRNFAVRVSLVADSTVVGTGDNPNAFFGVIGTSPSRTHPTTVNLPFSGTPAPADLRNRVLHEFCHALGCLHEHQRAGCQEQFDPARIKATFGLNDEQYELNFGALQDGGAYGPLAMSGFDPDSVMLYRLNADMFRSGATPTCLRVPPAHELSSKDIAGLRSLYSAPGGTPFIEHFALLAQRFEQVAQQSRANADAYRSLILRNPMPSGKLAFIETLVADADVAAVEAEAEAASFTLDETDLREAQAALALLASDL